MKIINVPIEGFEERYSTQWQKWFLEAFKECEIESISVAPETTLTKGIETGSFLDVFGTNWYKALQLQKLIDMLHKGVIKDDDWIFFHDLWFPGIEMLAYIRDGAGIDFKIAGCLHAGTWDEWDFVCQKEMDLWATDFEVMLFEIIDLAFLATDFHKDLILDAFQEIEEDKIKVTGFPIFPQSTRKMVKNNSSLVVFPHRLDPEKQPELFDELYKEIEFSISGNVLFLKTKKVAKSKTRYYEFLAQAEIAISFALQETWGIAMQEALFAGAVTLVPDRLSYVEMYDPLLRFGSFEEAASKVKAYYNNQGAKYEYLYAAQRTRERLRIKGSLAISNMLKYMGFVT